MVSPPLKNPKISPLSRVGKMEQNQANFQSIDEYIALFPAEIQEILENIRLTIRAAAPGAVEKISYRIPTFAFHGNLVHFAAYTKHIGFYPASSGVENFKSALAAYKTSRGAIQFPLDKPIPYDLISEITRFRYHENLLRASTKEKRES